MKKLIVVLGPTASGKSALGIRLAQKYDGEIISADSMQIYKGMDIGTAKIKVSEMKGIPHYLIDIKNPVDSFSVSEYQALARDKVAEIFNRKKTPIIVGGTGLYINSILYNYKFNQPRMIHNTKNDDWRQIYQKLADEEGKEALYNQLAKIDPLSAKKLHPNDIKRVIRALEYFKMNGKPISENNEALDQFQSLYPTFIIGLDIPRDLLYQRIEQRVEAMMVEGLIEEVRQLLNTGSQPEHQAMQGIGYRQTIQYIQGKISLLNSIALIKQESRRYAKRQLTWFRRNPHIHWINGLRCNK